MMGTLTSFILIFRHMNMHHTHATHMHLLVQYIANFQSTVWMGPIPRMNGYESVREWVWISVRKGVYEGLFILLSSVFSFSYTF